LPYVVNILGDQQHFGPDPSGGQSRFDTGVAGTDDDHVMGRSGHGSTPNLFA
jgi:hypothetical protein